MNTATLWLVIDFMGQAFFSCRFILQWLVSERAKKSIIPITFWYCSILGGSTLLAYAIYKRDPVFIMGQSTGLFVYFRNLHLLKQENRLVSNE